MKCEAFEKNIIDYLDGKLDTESTVAFNKHMESCEKCRDEFQDFQEMMKMFDGTKEIEPDESLRVNFYHMLHNEIRKQKGPGIRKAQRRSLPWHNNIMLRIAAGIALFVLGALTGMIFLSRINHTQQVQMSQLRSEVTSLKKSAMFTLLKEQSSSERLQALYYADEFNTPDQHVITALIRTLNTDKNSNVRMAAAYALSRYANQPAVCDSLVRSLTLQDDPILQVTLMNILVERHVKAAITPMDKIIADKNTLEEVKQIAENGIKTLI